MTNLNSYTIENYLYKIGDTLKLGKDTLKIESIVSINDTVFFFCSKLAGHFHSRVSEYIGTDPMYEGLFGSINSATVRYKSNLNKFPDFTKSIFIQADGTMPLTVEAQEKKIQSMTPENKKLIEKYFTKDRKFDIINSQFAIHYLFDQTESVNNLISTINTYLKQDGYVICTLFDPNQVMKLLNEKNGTYTSWYTDENGQRSKFFEIIKKFEGDLKSQPGLAIDVFMSWICQADTYFTEYLTTPELLTNTMSAAGCVLVDTDLFANLYSINNLYLMDQNLCP